MCGIAGIHNINTKTGLDARELEKLSTNLLLEIEARGRDATGIATIRSNGEITLEKADLTAKEFIKWRSGLPKRPKSILLHTRYATQGRPEILENNHPVVYDNALITHNGHISNDSELFKSEKIERIAQVDSEIIAGLFNKHGIEKAHLPMQKLDGTFAVAAIDIRKPTSLVLAKGWSSPLFIYKNDSYIVWASTRIAVQNAMKKAVGFEPKWADFIEAETGDLFYIENGFFEKLEFKPLENKWQKSKNTTSHYGIGYTSKNYGGYFMDDDDWYGRNNHHLRALPKVTTPAKPQAPISEYVIWKDNERVVIKPCEECNKRTDKKEMEEIAGFWYCKSCVEGPYGIYTGSSDPNASKEEDQILADWESRQKELLEETETLDDDDIEATNDMIETDLNQEHIDVCNKIGKQYGLTADIVDYILFGCNDLADGIITNEEIVELYVKLDDDYQAEYDKIIDLERNQGTLL